MESGGAEARAWGSDFFAPMGQVASHASWNCHANTNSGPMFLIKQRHDVEKQLFDSSGEIGLALQPHRHKV